MPSVSTRDRMLNAPPTSRPVQGERHLLHVPRQLRPQKGLQGVARGFKLSLQQRSYAALLPAAPESRRCSADSDTVTLRLFCSQHIMFVTMRVLGITNGVGGLPRNMLEELLKASRLQRDAFRTGRHAKHVIRKHRPLRGDCLALPRRRWLFRLRDIS